MGHTSSEIKKFRDAEQTDSMEYELGSNKSRRISTNDIVAEIFDDDSLSDDIPGDFTFCSSDEDMQEKGEDEGTSKSRKVTSNQQKQQNRPRSTRINRLKRTIQNIDKPVNENERSAKRHIRVPDTKINGVSDIFHPSLASEAVKRRYKNIVSNVVLTGKPIKGPDPTLTEKYTCSINQLDDYNNLRQISDFFNSPCPVIFCNNNDNGAHLSGIWMEYSLRTLVGAATGGPLEDIIGWAGQIDNYIAQSIKSFEFESVGAPEPLEARY
ncbi:hypothetical protein BC833DRAFT_598775 [Globomyces pollinis-pini]|nr:hypothetical protein BC833DRAFT_598775 [Globomyces pollinis-pini]